MKLVEIADNGDVLETLRELRHVLAETIEGSTSGRDIAALTRQLQIVMNQIRELEEQSIQDDDLREIEELISQHKKVRGNKRPPSPGDPGNKRELII